MRTKEQIIAQLEARYAELERGREEHETKKREEKRKASLACKRCRWSYGGISLQYCRQPLVRGYSTGNVKAMDNWTSPQATLCGPEKALWEWRWNLWRRFVDWFLAPWREA